MSNSNGSYPSYLNPFGGGAGSRGPGSELDHPGGSLYASLPPSSASGYPSDDDDLPPPPAEWLAPVYSPPVLAPVYRPTPNVVLPPFKPKRPAAWFVQCEDLFRMRGVTDQRDMFAFCYNMLGDEQQEQVEDIAEARPRPPDAFFRLRDRLVASHAMDTSQRVEQLMALPALGGQRPSALLAQMLTLCPKGEETGAIFRHLFMQRLPSQLRMQLAEDHHSPVQVLAARADRIIVHHSYNAVAAVDVLPPADASGGQDAVAAVQNLKKNEWRKKQKEKKKGGRSQAAGGKKEPWELLGICRHHYKYGEECYSCADPSACKWSSGN